MAEEFFSFDKAAERVPHSRTSLPDEVSFDSSAEMDKSILLYTHILKSLKDRDPLAREAMMGILSCVKVHGKFISPDEIAFFLDSIQDEKIWEQVSDFYWSFSCIHYRIMTELKLLDNLDHVAFRQDGTLRGVTNKYGRVTSDGNTVLVNHLAEIVLVHFYRHFDEWKDTLQRIKDMDKVSDKVDSHMADWGHVLMSYLTLMTFGGGIINYNKFVEFCLEREIDPEMHEESKYLAMMKAFDIEE